MAAPLATVIAAAGKKIAVDILTDPEKAVKYIFIALSIIAGILLLFVLPVFLFFSVPLLSINSAMPGDPLDEAYNLRTQTLAIYHKAPIVMNERAKVWVEQKKKDYSYANDIVVDLNMNLTWQDILVLDAVRLKQDFTGANETDVLNLAESFIVRESHTESYQEQESYQDTEYYTEYIISNDPKTGVVKSTPVQHSRSVTKTRMVTKTRAIINVSTKSFFDVLNTICFSSEEKEMSINMYNVMKNVDLEGNLNIYDDIDLSKLQEYPPGSANIPYFNQSDRRWAAEAYGLTGTIRSSGCGPTSLAMVVAGLTGDINVTPKTVADWSYSAGHRAEGSGSYWSLMTAGGKNWGLEVKAVSRKDPKTIVEALSNGYPIIVVMGPGHFTAGGHYIVLRGLTKDGNVLVYDPASLNRSNCEWSLAVIMSESSTNGGINGSPFWIFSK
jgi:hypothetical protein